MKSLADDFTLTVTGDPHSGCRVPQAIQQERLPSSESDVGRISARLKDKGKDYGDFWGARATGSSDRYDEFTWFIRWPCSASYLNGYQLFLHEQTWGIAHAVYMSQPGIIKRSHLNQPCSFAGASDTAQATLGHVSTSAGENMWA